MLAKLSSHRNETPLMEMRIFVHLRNSQKMNAEKLKIKRTALSYIQLPVPILYCL